MNTENEKSNQTVPEEAASARLEKVQGFQLNITLDEDLAAIDDSMVAHAEPQEPSVEEPSEKPSEAPTEEQKKAPARANKKKKGCLSKIIYVLSVALFSVAIAIFAIMFLIDMVALNRSDKSVDIEVPVGASTAQIAQLLHENGIIDYPFCFRVFSKLTGSDGKYQQGEFSLTANMGYSTVVDTLQTMTPRETVTVTIPEGYTVDEIAKVLTDNGVCDESSFYEAVVSAEYDFDFVKQIPTAENGDKYVGRIYLLEGYLFPDTYNFYVGCSGETVVKRMLENFHTKVTPAIREALQQKGMTLDEAIITASIIQGEAASKSDMQGVSRVLFNRLAPGSGFAKLQCDSTGDYVREILPVVDGVTVINAAYDTYEREGLPVGPINNPGMDAIEALLHPSEEVDIMNCYYFATDYDTEITYFTKTYAQHVAICRKYGIGMYG